VRTSSESMAKNTATVEAIALKGLVYVGSGLAAHCRHRLKSTETKLVDRSSPAPGAVYFRLRISLPLVFVLRGERHRQKRRQSPRSIDKRSAMRICACAVHAVSYDMTSQKS
jgi:hypothetical protein